MLGAAADLSRVGAHNELRTTSGRWSASPSGTISWTRFQNEPLIAPGNPEEGPDNDVEIKVLNGD
jgi:hypothetical protein